MAVRCLIAGQQYYGKFAYEEADGERRHSRDGFEFVRLLHADPAIAILLRLLTGTEVRR